MPRTAANSGVAIRSAYTATGKKKVKTYAGYIIRHKNATVAGYLRENKVRTTFSKLQ